MGSGGVRNAPRIRNRTMETFLYSRKNSGVRIPIFVKKIDMTGNWNSNPQPKISQRIYIR